jgi:hypothetical protein
VPASTFSLVTSSTKRRGVTMRTPSAEPFGSTALTPPKWSTWLCVKITATTGSSPRCLRASACAAVALSTLVSGSTMIQPVWPRIQLMFETS